MISNLRARRDLNPRPSGPEPDALSTELRALVTSAIIALLQKIHRVNWFAILTNLKVQVRTSG
jgi:hypothetical protein